MVRVISKLNLLNGAKMYIGPIPPQTPKADIKRDFAKFAGKRIKARDSFKPEFSHLRGNHAVIDQSCPVLKDLFETAKKFGLSVRLSPLTRDPLYTQYNYQRILVNLERKGVDNWVISKNIKIG